MMVIGGYITKSHLNFTQSSAIYAGHHPDAELNGKVSRMAKKKALPEVAVNNFVAKHMNDFNKSQTFVDRKKNVKRGYAKHKKGGYSKDYLPFYFTVFLTTLAY